MATINVKKALIGKQDLNLGTGTFSRLKSDGTSQTLNQINAEQLITLPAESRTVATVTDYLGNSAVYNVKDYGAVGDDIADDTIAIQNTVDAARDSTTGDSIVHFPPGNYLVDFIEIYPGTHLVGAGVADTDSGYHRGTELRQSSGQTEALIRTKDSGDAYLADLTSHFHNTRISDIRLRGHATSNTDGTKNHGIHWKHRTGDFTALRNVRIADFHGNGIQFDKGGTDLLIEKVSVYQNGKANGANTGYGVNIERDGTGDWHVVSVRNLTGDNNGTALVRVKKAGATYEAFNFTDIKSERSNNSRQKYVFDLDELNQAQVNITNLVHATSGATTTNGTALIHNGTLEPCAIHVRGWASGHSSTAGSWGMDDIVSDENPSPDVTLDFPTTTASNGVAKHNEFFWKNGKLLFTQGAANIATLAASATPTVAVDAVAFLTGGGDAITNFTDGYEGQVVRIIANHAIRITDGTDIVLGGNNHFPMAINDTLTLIQKADGTWYEIARAVNTPAIPELTIATDILTVTGAVHIVGGEGDANDDLETITVGAVGQQVILLPKAAQTITVKGDDLGNIRLSGGTGSDFAMSGDSTLTLLCDGTNWIELASSNAQA